LRRRCSAHFPPYGSSNNIPPSGLTFHFLEAEAVIGTMLILMRTHAAPSLSMHDGIIVPRSQAYLAKSILAQEYRRKVGVEPMLTVEPEGAVVRGEDL
jgi:hypothetical protein